MKKLINEIKLIVYKNKMDFWMKIKMTLKCKMRIKIIK
jgi:hypothetical protein